MGGGHQRVTEKQTRRMVALATRSVAPLVCDPRAPSEHRRKALTDASIARRGALPWHERSMGSGHHAVAVSIAGCSGGSGVVRS